MSSDVMAIVGGTLIDGTGADPVRDTTVIVRDAHICAVGSRASSPLPENATVLEARSRTVLPGPDRLAPACFNEWDKALFPQRGITSVRFAGGKQALILQLRDRVQRGELVGPRIFSVAGLP